MFFHRHLIGYAGDIRAGMHIVLDQTGGQRVGNGGKKHRRIGQLRRLVVGLGAGLGTGGGNGHDQIRGVGGDLGGNLTGRPHIALGIVVFIVGNYAIFLQIILESLQHRIQGGMLDKLADGDPDRLRTCRRGRRQNCDSQEQIDNFLHFLPLVG